MSALVVETEFADQSVPVRLPPRARRLEWIGGVVPTDLPITIVAPRGHRVGALRLRSRLERYGYRVRIRKAQAPAPIPPAERAWCPCCRERDKVVMPHENDLVRKQHGEPYCRRCKGPLSRLPVSKLPPNDFD